MKTCKRCQKQKDLSEFGTSVKYPDGVNIYCLECMRLAHKTTYKNNPSRKQKIETARKAAELRNSQFVWDYLSAHPCISCGESDPVVLEFDHRDPTLKFKNIAAMSSHSINTLKAEIEKCDVLCANCHARKTAHQFGYYARLGHTPKSPLWVGVPSS